MALGRRGVGGSSLSWRVVLHPLSLHPLSILLPVGVKTWSPHLPLTCPHCCVAPLPTAWISRISTDL